MSNNLTLPLKQGDNFYFVGSRLNAEGVAVVLGAEYGIKMQARNIATGATFDFAPYISKFAALDTDNNNFSVQVPPLITSEISPGLWEADIQINDGVNTITYPIDHKLYINVMEDISK